MRIYVDSGVDNSVDISHYPTQRLYRATLEMRWNTLRMLIYAAHSPAVAALDYPERPAAGTGELDSKREEQEHNFELMLLVAVCESCVNA